MCHYLLNTLQYRWTPRQQPNSATLQCVRHPKRIIRGQNGPAISHLAYQWSTTRHTRRALWPAVAQSARKWFRLSITYMYLLIPGLNQRQSTKKVTIAHVANDRQRSALSNNCGYRIQSWKMTPFTRYCPAMWWIIPNSFDRTKSQNLPIKIYLLHFPHTPKHTHAFTWKVIRIDLCTLTVWLSRKCPPQRMRTSILYITTNLQFRFRQLRS